MTAYGPAWVDRVLGPVDGPLRQLLVVLGHGAGGGVDAPDLLAVSARLADEGAAVVRVTQPYRVAGRRAPPPARQLDAAWTTVVPAVRADPQFTDRRLVVGGRSSGARVACRTAPATGAVAVVALAFPLRPPGREVYRTGELAAGVPVLVVQGERDAFGTPAAVRAQAPPEVEVVAVPGADHAFQVRAGHRPRAVCLAEVAGAVADYLRGVGPPAAAPRNTPLTVDPVGPAPRR